MSTDSIIIGDRRIGHNEPPFVIAEMSANHGGDLNRAINIIRLCAEAGADAIKFQAYQAHTMTLDSNKPDFVITGDTPWTGQKLFELYRDAATPYEWFPQLFKTARDLGIIPFASPFDFQAIDMLESLDAPAYKIASFELVDVELIARCAATGKPLIISTGMGSESEIDDAVSAARKGGCQDILLLKCTSAYPAIAADANLMTIPAMAQRFGTLVGLSDHTIGTTIATAACAIGACAVEKHVIDTREPPTADSTFSALPEELAALVTACNEAVAARGKPQYGPAKGEVQSLNFRRSLYAVQDISAGDAITRENVRSIRPGHGLPVKDMPRLLDKKARVDIEHGTPMSWDLVN